MSNSFTNWLASAGSSSLDGTPILKDYQHASRLYVDDTYAYAPKVGFLYYVAFNISSSAILDKTWEARSVSDVGLLVKKIDLPKFNITTETLNQYNRKTVVQNKINYSPVSIDFHDDNADIINNLWINYYRYYYADSTYGGSIKGESIRNESPAAYRDTKFGTIDYQYGRYDYNGTLEPFLMSVDIYVLHQGQFTQITLLNPKVSEWSHDSLNQAEGAKILQNRMTLAYESVLYNQGQIVPGQNPEGFAAVYYDKTPSPLVVGGNSQNQPNYSSSPTAFDQPGKARIYGKIGGNYKERNPILDIATILLKNRINQKGLGRVKGTGYNIAGGVLGALGSAGAGKYGEPTPSQDQAGIFSLPGGVGINIFKGLNTSVDGKIRANPAALIFPKIGGGGG